MLIERKIILGEEKDPLMVLEKHSIGASYYCFASAQEELLKYEKEKAEDGCTWGFFPGLEKDEESIYPNCTLLMKQLYSKFITSLEKNIDKRLKLAFVRVASKEPKSQYGGMHIDVDIGVGHSRDPSVPENYEIVRALLNPYRHPRLVSYTELDRNQLKKAGLEIPSDKYLILNLPRDIQIKVVEIPPLENDFIHMLKFWSSLIPHCGLTDEKGHYLIAFGAYADKRAEKI